ncbi:MAG TPA: PEGA domain-containing protein, partial [Kofleriaceae bacterium]|nr:PEGA domain-containing protein [Kofleriaceae bacterium]
PARVALRPPPPPAAAPARPAGGRSSITEVWEIVVRVTRSWTADRAASDEPPAPQPSPRRPARRHRSAAPAIDCGNDPLCPLVAPNAARLVVATDRAARIFVDGQDVGPSPRVIELIPGRHRVTLRFDGGGTRSAAVVLDPGERRTLYVRADRR